ncbi:MAG TPA: hypothetical protein VM733_22505 [Thermoanaerobaculia bacterium]|nr:hypothetical protein [Thermoanaerobaculia bacterium]
MTDRHDEVDLSRIALIEPHDGRLSRCVVRSTGSVEMEFDHLAVYELSGADQYDIWSYRASLILANTTRIAFERALGGNAILDDAALHDSNGGEHEWREALASLSIQSFTAVFTYGTTIDIACSACHLELRERVRYVERWVGPL